MQHRAAWEGLAVAVAQRPAELHGQAHGAHERPRLDLRPVLEQTHLVHRAGQSRRERRAEQRHDDKGVALRRHAMVQSAYHVLVAQVRQQHRLPLQVGCRQLAVLVLGEQQLAARLEGWILALRVCFEDLVLPLLGQVHGVGRAEGALAKELTNLELVPLDRRAGRLPRIEGG